ncbi:MAG: rod shape-determining protein MreC [Bacteroidales bacterium]|uniref:rod shape-determining protein MreC n=1 Tax=Candidatus Cryptobacteroides sp. TaxID=2952915 RepID=UPI002A753ABE|nr:rod shape-determining protein MreC [Candidatus Cryptobacteroides sp.]MDD7134809.1 rod shape-determining protein MreC [Bacteroidales bacterium]MDD7235303.1 rod shape-determining protein MreC [Bacteroidales bacterium]MDY2701954.1 rod shape-determining protein MreC [Candidatus Cryptobacteroides sp.]MDY3878454.1 rod shape-determining protein MreC [Candidatus Cryptobacteroides sp.]MDY5043220.1 rod shape-determining protein MreC [Candidatus Cryptobacteroides sp.]
MARSRSVGARILCAAVFILLETAAIVMLNHNNSMQRLWTMRLSHGFMAKTWGFTQKVRGYFSLAGQNEELALENHRLREMIREYEDAAKATDISLQSVTRDDGFVYTPAQIIKSGTNSQHNYLILDKGSEDGIVQNSGIISSKGVIGIVDAVSRHYSYAISFLNTEVNISSRLGGTGAVGPLAWDGKNTDGAILKEIPLQYRYSPGDTVYTSGYSVIFPPDIPLGTAGDASIINGATNEITVNLFQDYTALKFVTIVRNTRASEIEALEQTREDKDNKRKR